MRCFRFFIFHSGGDLSLRQAHVKRGTLPEVRLGPHCSAVPKHNPLHVGKPDAGTFKFLAGMKPLKSAEQSVRFLSWKTNPVVTNINSSFLQSAIPRAAGNLGGVLPPRVLQGIGQKVYEDKT